MCYEYFIVGIVNGLQKHISGAIKNGI